MESEYFTLLYRELCECFQMQTKCTARDGSAVANRLFQLLGDEETLHSFESVGYKVEKVAPVRL